MVEDLNLYKWNWNYTQHHLLERLMNYIDRILYAAQYFHGKIKTASLYVRASAMVWNFHPYDIRTQSKYGLASSPFERLNGFKYQVAHQIHAPRAQGGGFAIDVKAAHAPGNQLECRFRGVAERFFAKLFDEFFFHIGHPFPRSPGSFTKQEMVDFIAPIR